LTSRVLLLSAEELLEAIAGEIMFCPRCRLSDTRNKAVPGEGSALSKVMLVGEGPGRNEDAEGRPFVGQAGKFLETLLTEAGLARSEVFICNVVRCRPPENRDPLPDEIDACTPYLNRQTALIKPKVIVSLGKHSTAYIFSKAKLPFDNITKARGKFHETKLWGMQLTIFPTFHPAAALYNGEYKNQLVEDFRLLGKELARIGITK
jgi:uracil-DNA glycosylase family 4